MSKFRTTLFWTTVAMFVFSLMKVSVTEGKLHEGIHRPIDRALVATDVTVMLTEIISAKDATDKFVREHQWTPESISQLATTLGYYKAQLETLVNATPQMTSDVRREISQIDEPDVAFALVSFMNYWSLLFVVALAFLLLVMDHN